MGNVFWLTSTAKPLIPCSPSSVSSAFPLEVTQEAARAAGSAALSPSLVGHVVGYTTAKTRAAGCSAMRVRLLSGRGQEMEFCDNVVVSVRAPGCLAFVPGLAAPQQVHGVTTGYEIIVFARPDSRRRHITQLEEPVLRALFPEGEPVDIRVLRPLMAFEDEGTSDWLADHILRLALLLEMHFGPPKASLQATYELVVPESDAIDKWLCDAGIEIVEEQVDGF
mmetsp:Transcript_29461/g.80571  ORF Transcript_29461/g.80571 Transcript_29461/m.80571 type:complete len:223 (-) Transcript_29461:79-747(-)